MRPASWRDRSTGTFIGAFAKGDLLQVLLVSLLTGFAVTRLGEAELDVKKLHETMAHPIRVGEEMEELPA